MVAEFKAQQGQGQSAGIRVCGNQRVEGLQPHFQRHILIFQIHLAEGIGGLEATVTKPGQAMVGDRGAGLAFKVLDRDGALQRPRTGVAVGVAGVQREEGLLRLKALGRSVDDFPVLQVAAPAQRDGAGADTAEGQGDTPQVFAFVARQDRPVVVVCRAHLFSRCVRGKLAFDTGARHGLNDPALGDNEDDQDRQNGHGDGGHHDRGVAGAHVAG